MKTQNADEVTCLEKLQSEPPTKFIKVKDLRGHEISGIWVRGKKYYLQLSFPGKGCRRVPLRDDQNQPVKTVPEAIAAAAELRKKSKQGEFPNCAPSPAFNDYVKHYLAQIKATEAKKPKTIVQETSILKGWVKYLQTTRLNRISLQHVTTYITKRKGDKICNRTANLDVLTLNNCLKFAKREGHLIGKLPTEGFERLPYKAPARSLITKEQIEKICTTAVRLKEDGTRKYRNGELLADVLRFLRCSGARISSALATQWIDVSWERRQVSLRNTKYDRKIVVDFNPELEAHLQEMHARRLPDSLYLFPGPRTEGSIGSVGQTLKLVRAEAGLPKFGFHDCRHSFISYCVMSGTDLLTIAKWCGHHDTVLISRVYGHLASEHTQRAGKKVSFELGAATPSPNSNMVDLTNLTAADLISILHRIQKQGSGEAAK